MQLREYLTARQTDPKLSAVVGAIADATRIISSDLRTALVRPADTTQTPSHSADNTFGDIVLSVDLLAEREIAMRLRDCPAVVSFASEEQPQLQHTNSAHGAYSVTYDPLDGSSIIGANFSVGSIFGIWQGKAPLVGQRVRDMAASIMIVYGPRTVLYIGLPANSSVEGSTPVAAQFLLMASSWVLTADAMRIGPKASVFSPGNLRAAALLPWYKAVLKGYAKRGATLRYTGGMVPDVAQMLVRGQGIFMTPQSPGHKVKLRVAFECGPLAFLVHCAGGAATDGEKDYLDTVLASITQVGPVAMGSAADVAAYETACRRGGQCKGAAAGRPSKL